VSGGNVAASVRARLRNIAVGEGIDFAAVLTRYGLERMLYRLCHGSQCDAFLLKGALLFDVWFDTPTRPTRDIDLLAFGPADKQHLANIFREACMAPVADGIDFDPDTADVRRDFVVRSTMASARLEGREVPAGHVRSRGLVEFVSALRAKA